LPLEAKRVITVVCFVQTVFHRLLTCRATYEVWSRKFVTSPCASELSIVKKPHCPNKHRAHTLHGWYVFVNSCRRLWN